MVERQLRARGIVDPRVLDVMLAIPRERFVPLDQQTAAYSDRAVPLHSGATISQPYVVGAMTQALALGPRDRVLEVGTGSGYQTAVLAGLAQEIYSMERIPELLEEARTNLVRLGITNVHLQEGDGSRGWPEHGPYDAIIVTAAAPRVPEALKGQLRRDGGRMVVPVGPRTLQELLLIVRNGDEFERTHLMNCRFVPLVDQHEG